MIADVSRNFDKTKMSKVENTIKRALQDEIDSDFVQLLENPMLLAAKIRESLPERSRIAFISGNFNIVHTGHVRLLNFAAECADFLVVAINSDSSSGALITQRLRSEGVLAIGFVDLVIPLSTSITVEQLIAHLQPDIVVKGSEHEQHFNPEQAVVDMYGGKLLFSSGEIQFSSIELLRREFQEVIFTTIKKPVDFLQRHSIDKRKLAEITRRFSDLSVVVIGDLIIDEYLVCDALGISREDPTIVVTPIKKEIFVGGAGIVAAHAKGLGAKVSYFSVIGKDEAGRYASQALKEYGVDAFLAQDDSRPTTLKQRYRVDNKTLLRVSHLRHHSMSSELAEKLLSKLSRIIKNKDLLIFSDFNYGCLPQSLVDEIISLCNKQGVRMVADSQSSSQIGDVSRFQGMLLITPTEHEARLAVRDQTSGLMVLANSLHQRTGTDHVFITLGAEGLFVHSPGSVKNQIITDQLPAFNTVPKDVSGGGDCLLVGASLALATGATIWESAYLGSIAAACHVGRIGNQPLLLAELLREVSA